jgi:predicted O-methyltransferase YrrM
MMLKQITQKYEKLNYMNHKQALYLRDLILSKNLQNLCELGHYHGKSSAYLASILSERGSGKLTTYDLLATVVKPGINDLLSEFNLQQYVDIIISREGYIWDLAKRIQNNPENKFDFCYIDGGHTFESTGLGFVLVNILMKPGGYIVFDDVKWTINNSPVLFNFYKNLSDEQKNANGVEMVCDLIIPHHGYELIENNTELNWAVFKKL